MVHADRAWQRFTTVPAGPVPQVIDEKDVTR
jgi:hypothetical protein